ncbi:MAG: DUF5330 domain-containing protein [Hyphomicrobiales bacterium]
MRVFRTIILLTGIAVLMPSPPELENSSAVALAGHAAETAGLATAASQAVSDVASFCTRRPGVCQTAGYVAAKLEAKAKYGVRFLYEWANEANGEPTVSPYAHQADAADPLETGSTLAAMAAGGQSQSTLTIEDLLPEWRGHLPPKKG